MKIQIWTNEKENKAIATVEMFPEKNVVDGFQKWGTVATSLSDDFSYFESREEHEDYCSFDLEDFNDLIDSLEENAYNLYEKCYV